MEASLFIDGAALPLVDRVALLAGFVGALLLVLRPALLLALGLEEALAPVGRGADQLAVLVRSGEGVGTPAANWAKRQPTTITWKENDTS